MNNNNNTNIKLEDVERLTNDSYLYCDLTDEEIEWVKIWEKIRGWTFRTRNYEENKIVYYFCPKVECQCRKCFENLCGDGICCDFWVRIERKK